MNIAVLAASIWVVPSTILPTAIFILSIVPSFFCAIKSAFALLKNHYYNWFLYSIFLFYPGFNGLFAGNNPWRNPGDNRVASCLKQGKCICNCPAHGPASKGRLFLCGPSAYRDPCCGGSI